MRRFATALCILLVCAGVGYAQNPSIADTDFDGSGRVDFADFLIFAQGYGKSAQQPGFDARLDLNGNGTVDFADFLFFVQNFGKSPSDPQQVLLYIADLTQNRVQVVDVATNLLDPTRTLIADEPRGIALSGLNRQIYVAGVDTFYAFSESGGTAYKIPLAATAGPGQPIESRGGFSVVMSKNQDRAFITEEGAAKVEVFEAKSGLTKAQVDVPATPIGIAMAPDGLRAYVAHGDGATAISVIDAQTPALIDSIPVKNSVSRLALSPDGSRLYTNNLHGGALQVIDPVTKTTLRTLTLGDSTDADVKVIDIAISPDGSRLIASLNRISLGFDTQGNLVPIFWAGLAVFDTATWAQTATIHVADLVANMGLSPDGKTVYVAGAADLSSGNTSNLQVFIADLESGSALGTIRGLNLPVAFAFRSGKPVISMRQMPQLSIF